MLSIPDMAILGAFALLVFGPEQLPRVARKAGVVMREIQNTSQSFIREMERAADLHDAEEAKAKAPPYDPAAYEAASYEDAPTVAFPEIELPAPDAAEPSPGTPEHDSPHPPGHGVAEKLAEPRPAIGAESPPGQAPPEVEHPTHL